jgi:glycosyltransferase involved in cell wall biosynthesis
MPMKLVIQVPCLNEEATLALVLDSMPTKVPGIETIEIVVIDDGSTDATVEVARSRGITHIVHHARTMGLARSFRDGVEYALGLGADIVVNTDGDNQYPQERIGDLVQPILRGEAEIVIGDRQTSTIKHFSPFKRAMQRLGSWAVNRAAGTTLPDAASGFRAYSRRSLYRLNVVTTFSYCMETIIQAGNKRLAIASIEITTNPKTRESRLFSNVFEHMAKSGQAIVRSYIMYRPWTIFAWLTGLFAIAGLAPFVRFAILRWLGDEGNHLQSLIFGVAMLVAALLSLALGVLSDLQRTNRILQEDQLERLRELRYGPLDRALAVAPSRSAVSAPTRSSTPPRRRAS